MKRGIGRGEDSREILSFLYRRSKFKMMLRERESSWAWTFFLTFLLFYSFFTNFFLCSLHSLFISLYFSTLTNKVPWIPGWTLHFIPSFFFYSLLLLSHLIFIFEVSFFFLLASFFFSFSHIQVLLSPASSVFFLSNSSFLFSKHFWFCLSSFVLVVSCECCSHFAPYTSLNKHVTTLFSPSIHPFAHLHGCYSWNVFSSLACIAFFKHSESKWSSFPRSRSFNSDHSCEEFFSFLDPILKVLFMHSFTSTL